MIENSTDLVLEVTATDKASMDRELDSAVQIAREHAMRDGRRGILVTRHGAASFTVAVSHHVPFGLTQEKLAW